MQVDRVADDGSPRVGATLDLLFRRRSAQLTATLTRILGLDQLDLVEDVVQDAFVQAFRRWPSSGVPENPGAWVLRVAKNRAIDVLRRQGRWESNQAELERSILPAPAGQGEGQAFFSTEVEDDELRMIFAMCHPALTIDAQVALTLKTVGGFGVGEIARAFLTSKSTVAQRLVRAKRTLREQKVVLEMPEGPALPVRMTAVLEVLYLMFNEGHSAATGDELVRADLCGEAIRLAELLAAHSIVGEPRVNALAALFLFQAARIQARTSEGKLVPLEHQDRSLWDRRMMRRALAHQRRSARGDSVTSYHLQAEIAGCHTLAAKYEQTDWKRILSCYDELLVIDRSPVVALNRIVAVAEVDGPAPGLEALQALKSEKSLDAYYHLFAVEAELLSRLGRPREAHQATLTALSLVESPPVRLYLEGRARHHMENCS